MTRKVVAYELLSLDGVAESPDNFVFDFDDEMAANLAEVIGSQDAVLLGRGMYDEWAPYWPTGEDQPFADFINGVPKYVFTSGQPSPEWPGTTVVNDDAASFVRGLKAGEGGDIGVHGSIRLTRSLLAAGLIDELRLVVYPAIAGSGRKLFDDDRTVRKLTLLRARPTSSGGLLLDYGVSGATA
jgi:dihydrofolate reductase